MTLKELKALLDQAEATGGEVQFRTAINSWQNVEDSCQIVGDLNHFRVHHPEKVPNEVWIGRCQSKSTPGFTYPIASPIPQEGYQRYVLAEDTKRKPVRPPVWNPLWHPSNRANYVSFDKNGDVYESSEKPELKDTIWDPKWTIWLVPESESQEIKPLLGPDWKKSLHFINRKNGTLDPVEQ